MKPDLEYFRRQLSYDPATGEFKWLSSRRGRRKDRRPGTIDGQGYRRISFDGKKIAAHRLAWLFVNGRWPVDEIDHINGIRHDNRIGNLREATRITNLQNLKRATSKSTIGLLGVCLKEGGRRFGARIRINTQQRWLGSYASPEDAHAAYVAAKRIFHTGGTL